MTRPGFLDSTVRPGGQADPCGQVVTVHEPSQGVSAASTPSTGVEIVGGQPAAEAPRTAPEKRYT